MRGQGIGDDPLFDLAKCRLTVVREDIGDGSPGFSFDGHVGIEQIQIQRLGQSPSDGRFSCTRRSDEDRVRAHRGGRAAVPFT